MRTVQKNNIREVIKEEYRTCATSCQHFLRKYAVIQHPTEGKMLFSLYPYHDKCVDEFIKHRYNIIAKGRQLGISTLVAGYILWRILHKSDYWVLVLATTENTAKSIVSKIQLMYDKLPSWYKEMCPVVTVNKLEIKMANGSFVQAAASSEKSVRSPALSLLVIDEAAFVDDFEKIYAAGNAAISRGGDCIMLSSPNGVGNKFHSMWVKAEEGVRDDATDPYNPIKLDWRVHPDQDEKWAAEQRAKLGPRMFAQEHEVSFLTSGHTVVDGEVIQEIMERMVIDPLEKRYSGDLWIWKYPDYSKDYVVTADVARGDGGDYSAFSIFDVDDSSQVASFKAKIGTREYARLLGSIGNEYNNALLVVDNRNMGWDVVQELINIDYRNLYYSYKNDPFFDPNIHLRKNYDLKDKKDMLPGLSSTEKVRASMVSKIELNMTSRDVYIRDVRTMNEFLTYLWINGKAQAQPGCNDDLVTTVGMFLFIRDTALRMRMAGIELTKKSLSMSHKSVYTPKRDVPRGVYDAELAYLRDALGRRK